MYALSVGRGYPFNSRLDILVEIRGALITVRRSRIIAGDWEMYRLPMGREPALMAYADGPVPGPPAFYQGTFEVEQPGDTFLDMSQWGKGIVFVNGHHLGRYWHVGPQQTLYLPGCWLQKGNNRIVVFEQQNDRVQETIRTTDTPVLEDLRYEAK